MNSTARVHRRVFTARVHGPSSRPVCTVPCVNRPSLWQFSSSLLSMQSLSPSHSHSRRIQMRRLLGHSMYPVLHVAAVKHTPLDGVRQLSAVADGLAQCADSRAYTEMDAHGDKLPISLVSRLKMSHEGSARVRHFQPRVHTTYAFE